MSAIAFRDPVTQFVDRLVEKRRVRAFYETGSGNKRCLIIRAMRDIGITFFLRHIEETAGARYIAVYADCASSDPEILFRKFFERLEGHRWLRWRALSVFKEFGDSLVRLLASVMLPTAAAAAVGPLAAVAVTKVATTPYASTPSERFAKLITSGHFRRRVVFLVDNAQEIKPQSLHILNTVFSSRYDHVRFVLSLVEDQNGSGIFDAFHRRLQAFGLGVDIMDFPLPDDTLIGQIATAIDMALSATQRSAILQAGNGSLSQILGMLQGGQSSFTTPTVLEKEILRFLLVAGQPLQENDILNLAQRSPRIVDPRPAVRSAIESLSKIGSITRRSDWLGDEIEIAPSQVREVKRTIESFADLVAASELYEYFCTVAEMHSPRHSRSAYGALLYKLAKQVDPSAVSKRAFDLVRISLAQADITAAEHYIERAIGQSSPQSIDDLYTLLAFRISIQEYQLALDTLDRIGREYWSEVRLLRIIHAIALNRVRAHKASAMEIDALLGEPTTTAEEVALLISYKVAGLLHDGDLSLARSVFEEAYSRLRPARNRGYALRNCAAVYFWGANCDRGRADSLLAEALAIFEQQQDEFGYYTTMNNRGALAASDSPRIYAAEQALPMFQESFDALAVFGTQHLEEVGANLGMVLMLTGQIERAVTHLRKAIAIGEFDFPQVLMESALAFAELMAGEVACARERVWQLVRHAADLRLPEAVYRANVNAAAVEAAAGASRDRFAFYVENAKASHYWAGNASLDRVVTGARGNAISAMTLANYFSLDYCQYWSQNPLSFLDSPILPSKTVGDHVVH